MCENMRFPVAMVPRTAQSLSTPSQQRHSATPVLEQPICMSNAVDVSRDRYESSRNARHAGSPSSQWQRSRARVTGRWARDWGRSPCKLTNRAKHVVSSSAAKRQAMCNKASKPCDRSRKCQNAEEAVNTPQNQRITALARHSRRHGTEHACVQRRRSVLTARGPFPPSALIRGTKLSSLRGCRGRTGYHDGGR